MIAWETNVVQPSDEHTVEVSVELDRQSEIDDQYGGYLHKPSFCVEPMPTSLSASTYDFPSQTRGQKLQTECQV
jgi:hypothetical protein